MNLRKDHYRSLLRCPPDEGVGGGQLAFWSREPRARVPVGRCIPPPPSLTRGSGRASPVCRLGPLSGRPLCGRAGGASSQTKHTLVSRAFLPAGPRVSFVRRHRGWLTRNTYRECGAAASPWPSAVRLRVPNSAPSSGGRRGGSMSPTPLWSPRGCSGTERPGFFCYSPSRLKFFP